MFIFWKHKISAIEIDCCIIHGAKQSHIERLQYTRTTRPVIYISGASLIISQMLNEQHRLPVEHRISYKILFLSYKALNGHALQDFITSLYNMFHHIPSVRRTNIPLMHQCGCLKPLGKELQLPKQPQPSGNPTPQRSDEQSADSFKIKLKAYLFNKAFW